MKIDRDTIPLLTKNISTFSDEDETFSPLFSTIGFAVSETGENGKLFFHYNRATRPVFDRITDCDYLFNKKESSLMSLVFGEKSELEYSFFDTDCFEIYIRGDRAVELFPEKDERTVNTWLKKYDSYLMYCGYSKNGDDRDPDRLVPFRFAVKAVKGTLYINDNIIKAKPADGEILIAVCFEALDPDEDRLTEKLGSAPEDICSCRKKTEDWIKYCTQDYSMCTENEKEASIVLRAIHTMLSNLTKGQGLLSKHISSFPSRGGYATHFLWDSCFQNLAYEMMNKNLAKEFLLQIAEFQRMDGKYPQFMCSTWARPHDTQPALVGWAAGRLCETEQDMNFISFMADSMDRNNRWWLTSRVNESGLVFCDDGLETGQDNSPRFDGRTILATDMNAYLLSQMKVTAKFYGILGNREKEEYWNEKANVHSELMLNLLYCEEDNLFYDVDVSDGSFVRIVSPNCILPLWAGVNLPEEKSRNMIEKYLLSEEYMFSSVPFPSVAYNQKCYEHENWWRGPMWMPISYLMLETLEKFGYTEEKETAAERLLNTIVKDGHLSELFDSETGEGMGHSEQGWTGATFIRLLKFRNQKKQSA